MKPYKANNNNELYYIFVYVALLIAGVAFTKKPMSALYAGGIFIPLAVLYILFYTRLTEIQVDSKKGTLTAIYSSHIKKKREQVFKIANLEWGYKQGDTAKQAVCLIYDCGKEVVKLKTDKDGWKNEAMYELVTDLEKMGVKRKFTGYM